MELKFHTTSANTNKPRTNRNKFVGVRQRPSGKWVAEIKNTTQKIRMWLGTFDTAEEAAQAYDEAACLLRGSNRRTNFSNNAPSNPALSLKIRNLLNRKRGLVKPNPPPSSIITNQENQETIAKTISTSKSSQNRTNGSCSSNIIEGSPVFDSTQADLADPYKPDLSCFNHCQMDFDDICVLENGFYVPKRDGEAINMAEFPDFEHMKVERQISASLYAMNGISEYWDNISDSINDPLWDVTTLCHMFCPSSY